MLYVRNILNEMDSKTMIQLPKLLDCQGISTIGILTVDQRFSSKTLTWLNRGGCKFVFPWASGYNSCPKRPNIQYRESTK